MSATIKEVAKLQVLRLVHLKQAHEAGAIQTRDFDVLEVALSELAYQNEVVTLLLPDLVHYSESLDATQGESSAIDRMLAEFEKLGIDGILVAKEGA